MAMVHIVPGWYAPPLSGSLRINPTSAIVAIAKRVIRERALLQDGGCFYGYKNVGPKSPNTGHIDVYDGKTVDGTQVRLDLPPRSMHVVSNVSSWRTGWPLGRRQQLVLKIATSHPVVR